MTANKPLFLFDVDKTLIDTPNLFGKSIVTEIKKIIQITDQEYQKREEEYQKSLEKYTDFDPLNYLQSIAQTDTQPEFNLPELAEETMFNPVFHQAAVFEDAIPTLTTLKESYTLGVFSESVEYWQLKKLELSGLLPYFDPAHLYIWRRKTSPEKLAQLPKEAYIVDDNPHVITELLAAGSLQPIWLNRVSDSSQLPAPTITSLAQLPSLLKTMKAL